MINLLQVSQVGMKVGGTEECIYLLCKYSDREKFNNFIWSPYGGGETLDKLQGMIKGFSLSSNTNETFDFIKNSKIDIIVIHSGGLNEFYIKPMVAFCRQFSKVINVEIMHRPLPSWGAPLGIDRIIAVSQYVASKQLPQYKDKVKVILNGIDLENFDPSPDKKREARKYFGIPEDAKVMGFIGHLAEWKRPQDIIEAAPMISASVKDAHFLIAGDGPLRPVIEKRIAELGVKNVHLPGMLSRTLRETFYSALDLFLFPTAEEAFALVVVEAMAMGLPVVSYSYGPIPELFPERDTEKFLVPFQDKNALAKAVIELLNNGPLCKEISRANLAAAKSSFSMRNTARSYQDFFTDLAASRTSAPEYDKTARMYRWMGMLNMAKGDMAAASKEYDLAVKLDSSLQADIDKDLAKYLIIIGQFDKVLTLLKNANDPEALALKRFAEERLKEKK